MKSNGCFYPCVRNGISIVECSNVKCDKSSCKNNEFYLCEFCTKNTAGKLPAIDIVHA